LQDGKTEVQTKPSKRDNPRTHVNVNDTF
jgi:hypothetical protein